MDERTTKKIINALSAGITISERPFLAVAEKCGISENDVVSAVREMLADGRIRRFAAVLRQKKIGVSANAMCAFAVASDNVIAAGEFAASLPEVSHCYEREITASWPYNLYAMTHAKCHGDIEAIAARIASAGKTTDYRIVSSVRELKKQNAVYYPNAFAPDGENNNER